MRVPTHVVSVARKKEIAAFLGEKGAWEAAHPGKKFAGKLAPPRSNNRTKAKRDGK